MRATTLLVFSGLAWAAACAAPGVAVQPQAGDFAFVEVQLRG